MKKGKWWLAVVAVMVILLWLQYGQKGKPAVEEITPEYQVFQNEDGKYRLMVPAGWQEEATSGGKFVSRTVFLSTESSKKIGNIGEFSVTVISSPSAEQKMATKEEFEWWMSQPVKEASAGGIVKLENDTVSGQPAVRLAEMIAIPEKKGVNYWSVTSWFRKDETNYYINMMGNGADFKKEMGPFLWMLSKFSFLP